MNIPITVTILTKNSEKYLKQVLDSLISFSEVLILDNGSQDRTFEILKEYPNITLYKSPFLGFGPLHNKACDLAKNNWILSVDSDEIVTEALLKEINELELSPTSVYLVPRKNLFKGQWIKGCGWWPDYQIKLFNRKSTKFTDAPVHESVITKGLNKKKLNSPLMHYSYDSIDDFLLKMQSYSSLFAKQYKGKRKGGMFRAITHSLFAFIKSYILKKGFLDGKSGFLISKYQADTAYYKYLKLSD